MLKSYFVLRNDSQAFFVILQFPTESKLFSEKTELETQFKIEVFGRLTVLQIPCLSLHDPTVSVSKNALNITKDPFDMISGTVCFSGKLKLAFPLDISLINSSIICKDTNAT